MARQAVYDFIKQFMPDIAHPKPDLRVTPHGLLYDFNGYFPQVQFTCNQLKNCLAGYLQLIDPVVEYVQSSEVDRPVCAKIYRLGHLKASELLLAYFGRTPRDEGYADLISYIKASGAAEKVEQFYNTLEPGGHYTGDGTKRILSIGRILKELSETV